MQKGTSARNLVKRSAEFLVTLLFMRIEFVDNNSKALETRLENRIQRIDDDLKKKHRENSEKEVTNL